MKRVFIFLIASLTVNTAFSQMETEIRAYIDKTSKKLNSIGLVKTISIPDDKLYQYNYYYELEKGHEFPFANQILINNGIGVRVNLELNWWGEGENFDNTLFELLNKIRICSKNFNLSNVRINWEFRQECNVSFEFMNTRHKVLLHPYTDEENLKSLDNLNQILDELNKISNQLNIGSQLALINLHPNYGFYVLEIPNTFIEEVSSTLHILNKIEVKPKNLESFKWGDSYPSFYELIDSSEVKYFWNYDLESLFSGFVRSVSSDYPGLSIEFKRVVDDEVSIIRFDKESIKRESRTKLTSEEESSISVSTENTSVSLLFFKDNKYLFNALNFILYKLEANKNLYHGRRGPETCEGSELEAGELFFYCSKNQLSTLEYFLYYEPNDEPYAGNVKYTINDFETKYKLR